MKKIPFVLVVQEYLQNLLEEVFFNHIHDRCIIFDHDNCFEKFDDFNVYLTRVEPLASCYLLHYFVVYKVDSDVVWINVVLDKFIQELQDQDSTMIQLSLVFCCVIFWYPRFFFLFILHFCVSFVFVFFISLRLNVWHMVIFFNQKSKELAYNIFQDDILETLLHL